MVEKLEASDSGQRVGNDVAESVVAVKAEGDEINLGRCFEVVLFGEDLVGQYKIGDAERGL